MITRDKHREISRDVMLALAALETKHGIKFTQGRGHFDNGGSGDLVVKFNVVTATGKLELDINTKWALSHYKLTDEERVYSTRGAGWRITGYNSRAHRYPITIHNERTGQSYRIPLSGAQRDFAVRTPVAPAVPARPAMVGMSSGSGPSTPARTYEAEF